MKKIYTSLFLLAFTAFNYCSAQYITIPDAAFVTWLQSNGYAACLTGNQLDTTCSAVLNATTVNCSGVHIHNLTGIQYFKSLTTLNCSLDSLDHTPVLPATLTSLNFAHNELVTMPVLPGGLKTLACDYNQINGISSLPTSLQTLSCAQNQIPNLPSLPSTLQSLVCDYNQLNSLPALPASLQNLSCVYNVLHTLPALPTDLRTLSCFGDSLSVLPALPAGLTSLNCNVNALTSLPALPVALTSLQCGTNAITSLPPLPAALHSLTCLQNQISVLPSLPAGLTLLNCNSNPITVMPALPAGLQSLLCAFDQLTALPALPAHLQLLNCSFNPITSLPALPSGLVNLSCNADHLTSLPNLPSTLTDFNCGFNELISLPTLPDSLHSCLVNYNTNLSCLPELKRIVTLDFSNTAIICVPDYGRVTTSTPALDTVPLCALFNSAGCGQFSNISGQVFYDQNNNCKFDNTDEGMSYVKAQLYGGGVLQQQVYSGDYGVYSFDPVAYGNYTVQIDTTILPFALHCPGNDQYAVNLSATDSISYSNDFAFKCPAQGFDIGVQSVINTYPPPAAGSTFTLHVVAGDLSSLYGAHCASGINGHVQLSFTGPVHFVSVAPGALTPISTSGDSIIWAIADYGALNAYSAFNLIMKTDSTAIAGTSICFTVRFIPDLGDNNPSNNLLTYCLPVAGSASSNTKEVYPVGNIDTANHWLTYTIRFQNTGAVTAQNLVIADTLDSNLDASTFQLLAYSAKNNTRIMGNDVVFNFQNIDLPTSLVNDTASRGYIQYKIKQKENLPVGTEITNTAYFYFDSTNAIVTNTTTNTLVPDTTTGIISIYDKPVQVNLYPNPANDYTTVSVSDNLVGSLLQLTDAVGRVMAQQQITSSKFRLQTGNLAKGIYLVVIINNGQLQTVKKLVVE